MVERRYITAPATVMVTNAGKGTEGLISFADFVRDVWCTDPKFGFSVETLDIGREIRHSFEDVNPGQVVGLRRSDWELLVSVVRQPGKTYNPEIMYQLPEFPRAVIDAAEVAPDGYEE